MKAILALILLPLLACAELPPVKMIALPVEADAHESAWSAALASELGVSPDSPARHVLYGRADVATDHLMIEVDRLIHIHGALGQALHYRHGSDKQAVIALIITEPELDDPQSPVSRRVAYFREVAAENGIVLWILRNV